MSVQSRSKVLTIMLIDIVDYTKLSTKLGRERFDELNETFDRIALPVFQKYSGWVVKKIGDSFLVAFDSATDSLHCAIEMQNKFWEYNEARPVVPIKIKVAINAGEVIMRGNDIYGEPVNAVSRMEKETKPGQIYFSNSVFLSMNKQEIPYVYVGKRSVKGIERPIELFRVKGLYEDEMRRKRRFVNFIWSFLKFVIWVGIIGVAAYFLFNYLSGTGFFTDFSTKFSELLKELGL